MHVLVNNKVATFSSNFWISTASSNVANRADGDRLGYKRAPISAVARLLLAGTKQPLVLLLEAFAYIALLDFRL